MTWLDWRQANCLKHELKYWMLVLFEVETVALSFVYRFYFNKYYSITSNFILDVYVENTVTSGVNHYKCVG